MSATAPSVPDDPELTSIPSVDFVRLRLAVVSTEAALLRTQLNLSKRAQKERERLKDLLSREGGIRAG
jgi:hypothetical protein